MDGQGFNSWATSMKLRFVLMWTGGNAVARNPCSHFVLLSFEGIVLCDKIMDFPTSSTAGHEFHSWSCSLALLSHPFVFTQKGHSTSKAYGRELKIFLADITPALVLTYDVEPSIVIIRNPEMSRGDPAWRDPLYQSFSKH
ncbi:hypothetical protein BDZ89DRAFT_1139140 [Hymenopellis radicata]|nr:hypothetical protein BDZ89DRAFT_1139140 [Hymenopellis radicata]